jgi:hypothetical protein
VGTHSGSDSEPGNYKQFTALSCTWEESQRCDKEVETGLERRQDCQLHKGV